MPIRRTLATIPLESRQNRRNRLHRRQLARLDRAGVRSRDLYRRLARSDSEVVERDEYVLGSRDTATQTERASFRALQCVQLTHRHLKARAAVHGGVGDSDLRRSRLPFARCGYSHRACRHSCHHAGGADSCLAYIRASPGHDAAAQHVAAGVSCGRQELPLFADGHCRGRWRNSHGCHGGKEDSDCSLRLLATRACLDLCRTCSNTQYRAIRVYCGDGGVV